MAWVDMKSRLSIDKQYKLILTCLQEGIELSTLLEQESLTYDDLRYVRNGHQRPLESQPFRHLDEFEQQDHRIPYVSFFSGAGGMDLGFERAGFCHIASFDIEELFCKTLKSNRPDWKVFAGKENGDLRHFDAVARCLEELNVSPEFEGVFVGGPPCQPFSIAANQRFAKWGDNFKRIGFNHTENGTLLYDYIRLITHFRPRVFLIENVPGILTVDGGSQLEVALQWLRQNGYSVTPPTVLNASSYLVPQDRQRVFVVGWRGLNDFEFPEPASSWITSGSALEGDLAVLPNYVTREHKAASIERYMRLAYGQRDKLGRVDRLNPNAPSKTVIAGGTKGGGRSHLHPHIPRTLAVRESARLQTFPDDYVFSGPLGRQFTQVGNAVPPILAYHIATSIASQQF